MKLASFVISPIGSNCYVLSESELAGSRAVIVDPGDTALEPVFAYIEANRFQLEAIWNTHGHFDHVMGVDLVRARYGVPAYLHAADVPVWDTMADVTQRWLQKRVEPLAPPDHLWSDGDVVELGSAQFQIWHTPGHSPGSVCFVGDEFTFTGDTLFAGSIGRTDFPLSSPVDMEQSLQRLLTLPDSTVIYPGHGHKSTIGEERKVNPFLVL
jgi:hydroxyacylglutathione hydrolase